MKKTKKRCKKTSAKKLFFYITSHELIVAYYIRAIGHILLTITIINDLTSSP